MTFAHKTWTALNFLSAGFNLDAALNFGPFSTPCLAVGVFCLVIGVMLFSVPPQSKTNQERTEG